MKKAATEVKQGALWWVPGAPLAGEAADVAFRLHLVTGVHVDGTVTTCEIEDVTVLDFDDDYVPQMGCWSLAEFRSIARPCRRYLRPSR